jgi:transcriptional regulator with XRE-family HTH domain
MDSHFGTNLKDWRHRRRMSQLALGLTSNVSARHIAFLETGRARPSRSMVIQLSDALEVPRQARNALLNAAGFAAVYRGRTLDSDEMIYVRAAVDWTLARHDPFPAFAIDRHWTLVATNRTAGILLETVGLRRGESLLDAMTEGHRMQAAFENWPQIARYLATRLRTESMHLGGDQVLDQAAEKLRAQVGSVEPTDNLPPVVTARYRRDGVILSFFSTIAQFGSAEDMTLADLRIELMFPADDATRTTLLAMVSSSSSSSGLPAAGAP